MEDNFFRNFVIGVVVVFLIIIAFASMPFTIISTGDVGIVFRLGQIDRVIEPGPNFITPFIESVREVDVTTQLTEVEAQAASKDLQTVSAKIAVNYQLDSNHVTEIYTQYRDAVAERLIAPSVQEAVKAATAKYTAEELVTKREAVRSDIIENLKGKVSNSFVTVTNVSITNLDFSAQFNTAIEAKVKAEQEALTAKNTLSKVQYEADQRVAQAEAEAKAIRLQGDAANSQNYIRLKELEVRLELAKKWNGNLPQNIYAGAPIPFIDVK